MNFLLKKELASNHSQINRYVSFRNPKSHPHLKNDEAIERSIKLWNCSFHQNSEGLYQNFFKLLQTCSFHVSIYPQHSINNKDNRNDVSCILEIENLNVGYLRVFVPQFDFTNFLVLMGCSQEVTFDCELFENEDLEEKSENILKAGDQDKNGLFQFSIDVDKLDISFLG